MSKIDSDTRDVLAGLSFHVGRPLPAALLPVALAHGARIGSWAYPSTLAVPDDNGGQAVRQLQELGRSLRHRARAAGISMLARGDAGWPAGTGCDDLPCLWVRGNTDIAGLLSTAVAVTGTRGSTAYGARTAADLAGGLTESGWTVVTNTGFGIDLHAATAALATAGPGPVLLTAGGLDLRSADPIDNVEPTVQRGAVISPFPPGSNPTRPRIFLRSHLLGSLAVATVLVEAEVGHDSMQALDAAAGTGRLACAMPGPASSPVSSGCHARIADGTATLVTDADDVITAIESPGGSTPGDGLFAVRAVAAPTDGSGESRQVPLFHVRALSHAHAANAAFDVLYGGHRGPVELTIGIYDPAGGYEAITVAVAG